MGRGTGPVPLEYADTTLARPESQRRIGTYELLFEIAKGGMGTVYAARSESGRLVAIKLMSEADHSETAVVAFRREARLTQQIRHPNVVQTLDFGERDGLPYLVMELVEGVSLNDLLKKAARREVELPPTVAAYIIAEVAEGLHAAHELTDRHGKPLDLVHRDVSPQNILLSNDGRVLVTDFGIAKLAGATLPTATGIVKGKFAYMSPEQTHASPLDRRSDIFSLGVVFQELLTLRRAFAADSPAETVLNVISQELKLASDERPDVPRKLAEIAQRCLVKKAEGRFATTAELAVALREALAEIGTVGRAEVQQVLNAAFEQSPLSVRLRAAGTHATATIVDPTVVSTGKAISSLPLHRSPWPRVLAVAAVLVAGVGIVAIARSGSKNDNPSPAEIPSASVATASSASAAPIPSSNAPPAASSATPVIATPSASIDGSRSATRPAKPPPRIGTPHKQMPPPPPPPPAASPSAPKRFESPI